MLVVVSRYLAQKIVCSSSPQKRGQNMQVLVKHKLEVHDHAIFMGLVSMLPKASHKLIQKRHCWQVSGTGLNASKSAQVPCVPAVPDKRGKYASAPASTNVGESFQVHHPHFMTTHLSVTDSRSVALISTVPKASRHLA